MGLHCAMSTVQGEKIMVSIIQGDQCLVFQFEEKPSTPMIVEKGKRELFSFSFNITHGIHDAGRILYLIIPLTSHFHYKKNARKDFCQHYRNSSKHTSTATTLITHVSQRKRKRKNTYTISSQLELTLKPSLIGARAELTH